MGRGGEVEVDQRSSIAIQEQLFIVKVPVRKDRLHRGERPQRRRHPLDEGSGAGRRVREGALEDGQSFGDHPDLFLDRVLREVLGEGRRGEPVEDRGDRLALLGGRAPREPAVVQRLAGTELEPEEAPLRVPLIDRRHLPAGVGVRLEVSPPAEDVAVLPVEFHHVRAVGALDAEDRPTPHPPGEQVQRVAATEGLRHEGAELRQSAIVERVECAEVLLVGGLFGKVPPVDVPRPFIGEEDPAPLPRFFDAGPATVARDARQRFDQGIGPDLAHGESPSNDRSVRSRRASI